MSQDMVSTTWRWDNAAGAGHVLVASPGYQVIADNPGRPAVLCYAIGGEVGLAPEIVAFARRTIEMMTAALGYPPPEPYQIVMSPRPGQTARGLYGLTCIPVEFWGASPARWRYLALIAHEVAHHWWGHVAQPYTLPGGLGLAEGMSEYWSARALGELEGPVLASRFGTDRQGRWRRELLQRSDSSPISKLTMSGNAIMGQHHIGYLKSGAAFQHLEWFVGRDAFDQASRSYLAACDYGVGGLEGFRAELEAQGSGAGLAGFWERWFDRTGLPELRHVDAAATPRPDPTAGSAGTAGPEDTQWLLEVTVEQHGRPYAMRLPAEVGFHSGNPVSIWLDIEPARVTTLELLLTGPVGHEPYLLRLDPQRLGLWTDGERDLNSLLNTQIKVHRTGE